MMMKSQKLSIQLEQIERCFEKGEDISESLDALRNNVKVEIDILRKVCSSSDEKNLVCAHANMIEKSFKLSDMPVFQDTSIELLQFKEKLKDRVIDQELDNTINTFVKDVSTRLEGVEKDRDNQVKENKLMNTQVNLLSNLVHAMDDLAKFLSKARCY